MRTIVRVPRSLEACLRASTIDGVCTLPTGYYHHSYEGIGVSPPLIMRYLGVSTPDEFMSGNCSFKEGMKVSVDCLQWSDNGSFVSFK